MSKAEIYTKSSCPWCVKAKNLLDQNGVQYVEHTIGSPGATKESIEAKIGNGASVRTVPQIFLDGKYVGGYTDLAKLYGA